jgi:hypothetical protein
MKPLPGVRFISLMLHPSTVDAAPVFSELLFGTAGHNFSSKDVLLNVL